ncbi:MAG: rod shape-determining protein [Thiotrichales bacterium]
MARAAVKKKRPTRKKSVRKRVPQSTSAPQELPTTRYIGIDLGTARSVVMASNGAQHWVESYVGFPKDFISRKLLGSEPLFGKAALENRLSLDVSRPLAQGVIHGTTTRDEASVAALINYLIDLTEPGKNDELQIAVGVPAAALQTNKMAIREAIGSRADKLMVVSEPFAVAYGVGALNNALVIDIGAGTVDFCIMHGTVPGEEDQRSLTNGGDAIDRHLLALLEEKFPKTSFSLEMVREFKEAYGFVGERSKPLMVEAPVGGRMTLHDITEEMQRACESVLPAIVETAADLIGRSDPDFQDQVRNNIILAGGGSQIEGIADAIADGLAEYGSVAVSCVDDPLYCGAEGALELAKEMPEEYWSMP